METLKIILCFVLMFVFIGLGIFFIVKSMHLSVAIKSKVQEVSEQIDTIDNSIDDVRVAIDDLDPTIATVKKTFDTLNRTVKK